MAGLKIYKIIVIIFLYLCATSCGVIRTLRYEWIPIQTDYKHFPQRVVANEGPIYHFYKANKDHQLGSKIGLVDKDFNGTNVSLDSFSNLHKTISFLIIRNDTIVYEKYNKGYTSNSFVSFFFLNDKAIYFYLDWDSN